MDKKPMYFQLEPNAFLSDIDFQAMTAQERGVYFTLILYLYANGGTVGVAKGTLYGLCNYGCDMLEWEQMWDNIKHKFVVDENGELTHKRVTQEIEEATHRMEVSRESGLRGAEKRWAGHRVPIADKDRVPIAKKRKGKVSKEKKNNPPSPPRGIAVQFKKFENFWIIYPRKVGKGKALESFQKISPDGDLLEKILVAVEQQSKSEQWLKDNGQFVPNPATWLNQQRWEDELPEILHKKTSAEKMKEYEEKIKQYAKP